MQVIKETPNPSGAYPPIQSWEAFSIPTGYAVVPDSLDTSIFYQYNGFVTLQLEEKTVIGFTPNIEAWSAWQASLPPKEEVFSTE